MEPPLWQCAIAVQTDPNIFFHCRPVDGATVMATKLVVEIGDAASRAGLSRVGYFIPLNAARWTGIRLVIYLGILFFIWQQCSSTKREDLERKLD